MLRHLQMSLGKYTYGSVELLWASSGAQLSVGKFCSIGANLKIYLGGNHRTDWITTFPFGHVNTDIFTSFDGKGHPTTKGNVNIGNDVWIGNNTTIMSGVTIGDGAVIANNSHVVKNVEPYSLVGGNPARHIKFRFSPDQIAKLLKISWWDWEESKINNYIPLLCSGRVDEFIQACDLPSQ